MSVIRPGDEPMHYMDGSHRWISPDPTIPQAEWEERVREHQRQHRRGRDSRDPDRSRRDRPDGGDRPEE